MKTIEETLFSALQRATRTLEAIGDWPLDVRPGHADYSNRAEVKTGASVAGAEARAALEHVRERRAVKTIAHPGGILGDVEIIEAATERGFRVRHSAPLGSDDHVTALEDAYYATECRRATEYLAALGITVLDPT